MIVIDSSFAIVLFSKSDSNHIKCFEFLKKNQEELHAPEIILIELASFFVRKFGSCDEPLEKLKKSVHIHGNYTRIEHVIDTIQKFKTRGADSLFVRLADKNQCELVTCDKDQAKKYPKSILI